MVLADQSIAMGTAVAQIPAFLLAAVPIFDGSNLLDGYQPSENRVCGFGMLPEAWNRDDELSVGHHYLEADHKTCFRPAIPAEHRASSDADSCLLIRLQAKS